MARILRRLANDRSVRALTAWLAGVVPACIGLAFLAGAYWPEPMPDFRAYAAGPDRKAQFFEFLRPLIADENRRVLSDRDRLEAIANRDELSVFDRWWVDSLAETYAVDRETLDEAKIIETLLRRVDVVPMSLALAQAAKESGWGTSRFARDGNNLFGEWCFEPGCGLVPRARPAGGRHEVEAFDTPRASVVSYLRNLNTHDGYLAFRLERARLREAGEDLSGLVLVDELERYSQQRETYVEDIRSLIHVNELADLPATGSEAGIAGNDD